MRQEILKQIESWKSELYALEIEKARIEAKLETLAEMLALAPEDAKVKRKRTRTRSLSVAWSNVLYYMMTDLPQGATYDQIHKITTHLGIEIAKENLRGHMGNYKTAGYVTSPEAGVFLVSPEGKKQAKEPINKEPVAKATGSKELGADGQGEVFPADNPSGSNPDASTDTSFKVDTGPTYSPGNFDDEIPY